MTPACQNRQPICTTNDMYPSRSSSVSERNKVIELIHPEKRVGGMMSEAHIKKPNGDYVVAKESLLYLGSFLCDNGSIGPELNRRLGAARAEFETLCRVWNHAVLKLAYFRNCCIVCTQHGSTKPN